VVCWESGVGNLDVSCGLSHDLDIADDRVLQLCVGSEFLMAIPSI
jgi:hypothetical protein